MKNKIILSLIVLGLVLITSECSEIYDPRLDNTGNILAVDAHMTDGLETYYVNLSMTLPYNSSSITNPVSGARVWVSDNNSGDIHLYSETKKGYYSHSPNIMEIGKTGHSYVLHIVTSEGDKYESSPEIMTSPVRIDSIYGIRKTRKVLINSPDGGSLIYIDKSYVDIITDIRSNTEQPPRVHFGTGWILEMIDYHRDILGGPPPPPTYSWTYTLDNTLNITEDTDNNILKEQYSGSLMTDNLAYLYSKENLAYIILALDYFSLNVDSYNFYNEMKKQLSSNDALFDPIEAQIKGNIRCMNNTEKQATGFFDVASHGKARFIVNPNAENSSPMFKSASIFNGLPEETDGKTEGIPPGWWYD